MKPLEIFQEISKIPRSSGDEGRIAEYLMAFARARSLEAVVDSANNVVIRKAGSAGYEDAPVLVLQSHSDMVYVKSAESSHEYGLPLVLLEKDGFLMAEGTSLGADNGIGMAYALALLDGDFAHPPLEALFTSDEETGMLGVTSLSPSALLGRRMINMDSTDEGVFIAGCAGGIKPALRRLAVWEDVPSGYRAFRLCVCGLLGGHSGSEIHKGRGNAIRLLGRALYGAVSLGARVGGLTGGGKTNVIPDRAQAVVFVKDEGAFLALVERLDAAFKNELSASDKGVRLFAEPLTGDALGKVNLISREGDALSKVNLISREIENSKALSEDTVRDVLTLIMTLPLNAQSMNMHLGNLVESSNNIGILECDDDAVTLVCAVRSSVESLKRHICDQMALLARAANFDVHFEGDYPEWAFAEHSPLRDKAVEVYTRKFGKKPEILSIHAGLECGFFKALYPEMDMISIGPAIFDIHSPAERVDIASAERVFEWLIELVAELG